MLSQKNHQNTGSRESLANAQTPEMPEIKMTCAVQHEFLVTRVVTIYEDDMFAKLCLALFF
jgi:hypothetical protein